MMDFFKLPVELIHRISLPFAVLLRFVVYLEYFFKTLSCSFYKDDFDKNATIGLMKSCSSCSIFVC